jgi:hypothetical protein
VAVSATRRGRAANALLASVAAMVLAGCASAGQTSGSISQSGIMAGAGDSCAAASPPAYLGRARTVFTGTALPGPTTDAGSAGAVLVSPAHFRVLSYLKGSGPRVVTVQTAITIRGNAVAAVEDGIEPRAGQRWRIYTASLHMPYQTSACGGSCVIGGAADGVNMPCSQEERH